MWEAFQHAGWEGLDNLVAIVDVNRLGQTRETMLGWDLDGYAERVRAFGWHAIVIDGHDVDAIEAAYAEAEATEGRPTAILARTMKGRGVKAVEDLPDKHGKPLEEPEAAIEELGGERELTVEIARPPAARRTVRDHRRRAADLGAGRGGRHAQGVRHGADRARRPPRRRRRARRRGLELDACRGLPRRARGPLLRDVHRRAAAGRRGGRHAGARLGAVRLHVLGVLQPRLRLRPDGGDLARRPAPRRLARRRVDRRGRPVADGARGPRRLPRHPRLHRAAPERREPDRGARRGDGGHTGDLLPAHPARQDPGAHARRRDRADRRQPRGARRRRRTSRSSPAASRSTRPTRPPRRSRPTASRHACSTATRSSRSTPRR